MLFIKKYIVFYLNKWIKGDISTQFFLLKYKKVFKYFSFKFNYAIIYYRPIKTEYILGMC